ncbi:MAG TPA: peptide ABC transporter substrate-binding protein [Pyrinomonadaceae bacterium]|nr:peptide ABC transporter substrate-binding protein [Pyrinomonadaceae bacterium]
MLRLFVMVSLLAVLAGSCSIQSSDHYFGKTVAPKGNVLHYISGAEIETLDPQVPDGQPDARILMALFEGLVEYDPKTLQPVPELAKSWEIGPRMDEFIFHLRDNAKWSDGTPITANDFVYSIRRGFAPDTLSRTSNLGYVIKYAEAFNGGQVFVKKGDQFLLAKDFGGSEELTPAPFGPETEFRTFIRSPERLTLPGDEKKRAKALDANPKLKSAAEGAEFVPVTANDIGIEAIDDYTLRITLRQSAPYFLGLLAHQFFRIVPQQAISKYGRQWTRPEHIVTCGPFRLTEYRPYDRMVVERDPNYWDAANVHLDRIEFYPVEEQTTTVNLYKTGEVDAFLNHSVQAAWIDSIRKYTDEYMLFPEAAVSYYGMNLTKPPFDNPKVRRAFSLAIDRIALSNFRKITKPLFLITPSSDFPDYDHAIKKVGEEIRNERKLTPEQWKNYYGFDPELARKLVTEAGFPVQKTGDSFSCPSFPVDQAQLTFNTAESNRAIAEFIQAQWRQNLGITVQLQNMEFKTFLGYRNQLQYAGFAQLLWSADYMDPFTFLGLFYGEQNNGDTGYHDPKFDKMLDDANTQLDPQKRYEMMARAEYYLLDSSPVIPLTINATNWMKKPYVKGMYPNPGTLLPWKFVYIERDPAKWDHDVENIMNETDPVVAAQLQQLNSTQPSTASAH